ncbi:MAG: SanA/YdcF family protein [Bacteroidota bacterium]
MLIFILVASNLIIIFSSRKLLFNNIQDIPPHQVAIVLGTSRQLKSGQPNPYFHYRISAAAELYHSGKVQYMILSGDNRTRYYNEPEQMRRELVAYHVPDSAMYLDYAGLRTLDSMVRSHEIFGQDSIIVVSQKFHNQRAIFLARTKGIRAVGFNATDLDSRQGVRTNVREIFARVKVFYDLITRKQPRHLGEQVIIGKEQKR